MILGTELPHELSFCLLFFVYLGYVLPESEMKRLQGR